MKIGFLVNNLGGSQLAYYLIRNVNFHLDKNYLIDVIAFYENLTKPCVPMSFASMPINEAWNYQADAIIATNLATAAKLLSFPTPAKKIFYVWDIEWLRLKQRYFRELRGIYSSPKIELWARSASHAELISDCWNKDVKGVVNDFNMNEIVKLCQN